MVTCNLQVFQEDLATLACQEYLLQVAKETEVDLDCLERTDYRA